MIRGRARYRAVICFRSGNRLPTSTPPMAMHKLSMWRGKRSSRAQLELAPCDTSIASLRAFAETTPTKLAKLLYPARTSEHSCSGVRGPDFFTPIRVRSYSPPPSGMHHVVRESSGTWILLTRYQCSRACCRPDDARRPIELYTYVVPTGGGTAMSGHRKWSEIRGPRRQKGARVAQAWRRHARFSAWRSLRAAVFTQDV